MSDTISRNRRSENMRRIRSKNTLPERVVRRTLTALGVRYRTHAKVLPGNPDIVIPKKQKAVFVHGCFWHLHGRCADGRLPLSRRQYWLPKLRGNRARDVRNRRALQRLGWKTLVIWDCETSSSERLLRKLTRFLSE